MLSLLVVGSLQPWQKTFSQYGTFRRFSFIANVFSFIHSILSYDLVLKTSLPTLSDAFFNSIYF